MKFKNIIDNGIKASSGIHLKNVGWLYIKYDDTLLKVMKIEIEKALE